MYILKPLFCPQICGKTDKVARLKYNAKQPLSEAPSKSEEEEHVHNY